MGLRSAASAVSSKSHDYAIRNPEMAPALTEPVNHRQTKNSSPAQASSPHPIISDINEPTQTTSNPHHRLPAQTNGGVSSIDSLLMSKETNQSAAIEQPQSVATKIFAADIADFQSAFEQQLAVSNGLGPSYTTHMEQPNTDQSNVINFVEQPIQQEQHQHQHHQHHHQQQQQHQNAVDLLDSIVNTTNSDGTHVVNQFDCSNLNDNEIQTTVEQLLAETQTQEFQQQLQQQEFLQQQHHQQHHHNELAQYQTSQALANDLLGVQSLQNQSIALLMADNVPSTQCDTSNVNAFGGNGLNGANQMQTNFLKENAEMEQMLGDLTGNDNDFMQVLKYLETAPTGENLGDLAGGLSLFNDVDVMNIGLEDVVTSSQAKEVHPQDMLKEIEKKRDKMVRDCDFMMRRLRKIQARHMGRHISEEVCGLYEYTQQMIKRKERETKSISTMTPINQLHSDKSKLNSASSWKSLLKRIEHAATSQQANTATTKLLTTASAGLSEHPTNATTSGASSTKQAVITCVPQFDSYGTQQLRQVAGLLGAEMKLVGESFDSDATASSSGGESADEGITYNNATQKPLSIAKRAAYRWARDRAKIASRWTWLLAQISELEYRIRQHQEQYILIKQRNGSVKFEGSELADTTNTSASSSQKQPSVNGYRPILPGSLQLATDSFTDSLKLYSGDDVAELDGAARTRAFKANEFNKRKLLQSTNLHKISRRAARPCTIKCGCRWPVHPCLLCTGRTDPTAPRDLPDMLSTQESVALLDPCFHPILSFPEDVSQTIHIEATLRQPEWQTKVAKASSKTIKGVLAQQKASDEAHDLSSTVSSSSRKNSSSANLASNSKKSTSKKFKMVSTKLKKSRGPNGNNNTNRKLKKVAQAHLAKSRKNKPRKNSNMSATSSEQHEVDVNSPNGSISRSKNPSPTPLGHYRILSDRRHNKNAYDIDNIVIPSNMTSRVEILSYKEIPTPKWRLIDENNKSIDSASQQDEPAETETETVNETEPPTDIPIEPESNKPDVVELAENKPDEDEPDGEEPDEIDPDGTEPDEDISNEAYMQRHERALAEEKKKFTTFLKFPYSTRSRANRRIDSQADSSGANTPDPMSPAPNTPATATNIDQESQPPTPQSVDANADPTNEPGKPNNNNNGNAQNPLPPILSKNERRRTVSFRKTNDPLEYLRRSTTPDVKETISPFDQLNFPLANNTLEQMIQCMPTNYKDIINECIDQITSASSEPPIAIPDSSGSTTNLLSTSDTKAEQFSPLPMLAEDSDETESVHEDPNDPEWFEPPQRIPRLQ